MAAPESVTFEASLPAIKSAILLDGIGDGGQIKLDVPRSDAGALVLLHQYFAGKSLKITVELSENDSNAPESTYFLSTLFEEYLMAALKCFVLFSDT